MNQPAHTVVGSEVQNVTVIGAGVIGISWAALFLARGLDVVVHDVAPDAEARVRQSLDALRPSLEGLGLKTEGLTDKLSFEPDLAAAVAAADVVQENGPDRVAFKRQLWADVEAHAKPTAMFLSSSSGIPASEQAKKMRDPSRMLIGHPFNPPLLIPLVEVVPHTGTDPQAAQRAMAFYREVGKHPMLLCKEIPGFVANRLQAALLRESILLVKKGVVTVDELDEIVTHSVGLRWATGGPFLSFHMGGGPTGFRGFLKHFARGVQLLWLHAWINPVLFTRKLGELLVKQVDASFGQQPMAELEAQRDQRQVALLRALHQDQTPRE